MKHDGENARAGADLGFRYRVGQSASVNFFWQNLVLDMHAMALC